MAILVVSYDLKKPGRNYVPVHTYLKGFTYCKGMESLWLLDTTVSTEAIRDRLIGLVDSNDVVFVARLYQNWGSFNYFCADWLGDPARNW